MPASGSEAPASVKRSRARVLRETITDAERKLWQVLRDRRLEGAKFRRQVPVGPYVADFLCFQRRLVVEADGGQHAEAGRDAARDAYFEVNGFRVLRFWNNDILVRTESVLEAIYQALKETPHPRPLSRKGRGEAKGGGLSSTEKVRTVRVNPSPLVGEGGSRRSRETGEGVPVAGTLG